MSKVLGLKLLAIGVLTLVIWGALGLVGSVIDERQRFRDEATQSIAESYAGPQTFIGPVLVQPYTQVTSTTELVDGKTRITESTRQASKITFPSKLKIAGTLQPEERRHGLYKTAVYVADAQISGTLDVPASDVEGKVTYGEPYLAFQLSDVRGIIGLPAVHVNGTPFTMTQGGALSGALEELTTEPEGSDRASSFVALKEAKVAEQRPWQSNLRVRLAGADRGKKSHYDFDLTMKVAGTQRLSVGPVGDLNDISLQSSWPSPLFAGRFLPRSPDVSASGFKASWSLSSLAAATQQQIATSSGEVDTLNVSLLTPVDPYKLSDRATKYGILFVVLTFGGFFLFEMMKHLPIHPAQYLLVGFGLAVFFLLLISFSEHMAFGLAYVIASAACIGLLTFYLSYVLRSATRGLGFGVMLTALYSAVYGLLISEDNALILGSLMLFAVLAAVMVLTRKIDWYKGGAELLAAKSPYVSPAAPPPAGAA